MFFETVIPAAATAQNEVIDEGYRDRGYGKLLLKKAEAYGKENDVVLIEILSASRRESAHRFYENSGYQKTGFRFFKTREEM